MNLTTADLTADLTAGQLAAISRSALDRPLTHAAELTVAVPVDERVVHGVFDRGAVRRGSGGAPARVGPGSVWVQLVVAVPSVDVTRFLNRAVRPLLAALTKLGPPARYFGRDWVSVDHAPAALVGFAHDAVSGRALFEAIVPVTTPFALADRPSFMGRAPRLLGVDLARAEEAITRAYVASGAVVTSAAVLAERAGGLSPEAPPDDEPPWRALREEPVGILAAGPDRIGTFRFGGEIMASRQTVAALEAGADPAGAWIYGVRSPETVRALLAAARA